MATKVCTRCGIEKPYDEFYKRGDRRGGLQPECKKCSAARNAAYHAKNKGKIAAYCAKTKTR